MSTSKQETESHVLATTKIWSFCCDLSQHTRTFCAEAHIIIMCCYSNAFDKSDMSTCFELGDNCQSVHTCIWRYRCDSSRKVYTFNVVKDHSNHVLPSKRVQQFRCIQLLEPHSQVHVETYISRCCCDLESKPVRSELSKTPQVVLPP